MSDKPSASTDDSAEGPRRCWVRGAAISSLFALAGFGLLFTHSSHSFSPLPRTLPSQSLPSPTLFWCILACLICLTLLVSLFLVAYERFLAKGKEEKEESHVHGGYGSLRAIGRLVLPWFVEPKTRVTAWGALAVIASITVVSEASQAFIISRKEAEVTNAVAALVDNKDLHRVHWAILDVLLWKLLYMGPIFWVSAPLIKTYFQIQLKTFVMEKVYRAYLNESGIAYYHIKIAEGQENSIDNPDQRIVEDSSSIVDQLSTLYDTVLSMLIGPIMWIAVIVQLGGIRVLVICLVAVVVETAIAYAGFGKSLSRATRNMQRAEAFLRYCFTRIRDAAEEIALSGGGAREHARALQLWEEKVSAMWAVRFVNMRFGFAVWLPQIFPPIVLSLCLFQDVASGILMIGDIQRVQMAYGEVKKVFGFFVDNFHLFTDLRANADRLHQLLAACEQANKAADLDLELSAATSEIPPNAAPAGELATSLLPGSLDLEANLEGKSPCHISLPPLPAGTALALEDVWVLPPGADSSGLVGSVSATCPSGEALLVMGPSGMGKTSLLRAISGLWRQGTGSVRRPGGNFWGSTQVLTSRCYLPVGTLLQLVRYPEDDREANDDSEDETALEALRRARLGHLVDKCGLSKSLDWRALLSSGEQQRLGFARLFCRLGKQPSNSTLVLLDEATSALDVDAEKAMYCELRKELASGGGLRGLLSVGHRPTLQSFHEAALMFGQEVAKETAQAEGLAETMAEGTWFAPDGKAMPWRHVRFSTTREEQTS